MKKLKNLLLESHPVLVEMVTNCLHNTPQTRPTAEQLLETLTSTGCNGELTWRESGEISQHNQYVTHEGN